MSDLKALTLKLLSVWEQSYFERSILETLLHAARVPGWENRYKELLNDPVSLATIHALFAPVYERVQNAANAEEALREFLRVAPKPGPPN